MKNQVLLFFFNLIGSIKHHLGKHEREKLILSKSKQPPVAYTIAHIMTAETEEIYWSKK